MASSPMVKLFETKNKVFYKSTKIHKFRGIFVYDRVSKKQYRILATNNFKNWTAKEVDSECC